jgi:hypothetical protein
MKKLISKAAEKAFEKGFECINIDLLALAFDEELALSVPGSINPFRTDPENLEPLKRPTSPGSGALAVGKRGGRKKNRNTKENISDILRK